MCYNNSTYKVKVIVLQTSYIDKEHIKLQIQKTIQHDFLEKHIEKPSIDEDKLFLLVTIINNAHLPAYKKERYAICTMLVQIALDTHDLIPKKNAFKHKMDAPEQLKVLAGDYYSGLYYFLLSELKDYPMIRTLASAIKDINEYKMQMYYDQVETFESYLQLIKQVESLLFTRVARFINEHRVSYIAPEWLLANKLLQEKHLIDKENTSPLIADWIQLSGSYSSTIKAIEQKLQGCAKHLKDYLSEELKDIITNKSTTPLLNYIFNEYTAFEGE